MANPEHLAILKQGVEVWNEWREKNPEIEFDPYSPDFSETDLRGWDLEKADFINANLSGTDLRESYLLEAKLAGADLTRANLSNARLGGADLFHAGFVEAVLIGTDLSSAILIDTDLEIANLTNATVGWTVFGNVDLSTCKGLETATHRGPSTIGVDTIFKSQGKIPEVFLRGCGVPDIFIEYAQSLVAQPIQFFSCFISHSSKDKRFCDRLYADLQAYHVRVWYFPEDAKWGEPVWGEIDRSIKIYDKLIVVCSKNSLTSGPVLREIERALRREDEERKNILFPITIDDYIFHGWQHPRQADVVSKVVGDFRGVARSKAKYNAAFRKLLNALKT